MSNYKSILYAAIGFASIATSVSAQLQQQPPLSITESGVSVISISAAEASYHVQLKEAKLNSNVSWRSEYYPMDSIRGVVAAAGAKWLDRLQSGDVRGIQLDPSGRVGVVAEQEAYAKAHIRKRLETPGLSFEDRAYAYLTAVDAFSDWMAPERLPEAEAYLRELDAMGDSAASWQIAARREMVYNYYMLGKSAEIIRHGIGAIERINRVPFQARIEMFPMGGNLYVATIEALAGQSGARARIDSLNRLLEAAVVPTPELVALDSEYVERAAYYERQLKSMLISGRLLGTQGEPLVSNYWVNRPTRDSLIVPVNDGKVRVLEIGTYGCIACLNGLQGLQRIQKKFPDIECVMSLPTTGAWGNRLVEPQEEAGYLANYFLNTAKISIPVAIWKGRKVLNEDGGMTPESDGPNFKNYPYIGTPTIWILDGRGVIRRVFTGFSREREMQIASTVQFLRREAAEASKPTNTPAIAPAR